MEKSCFSEIVARDTCIDELAQPWNGLAKIQDPRKPWQQSCVKKHPRP